MVKGTWFHASSNGRLSCVTKRTIFVKTSKLLESIYLQLKYVFGRERNLQMDIREGRPEPHFHAVNKLSNRYGTNVLRQRKLAHRRTRSCP